MFKNHYPTSQVLLEMPRRSASLPCASVCRQKPDHDAMYVLDLNKAQHWGLEFYQNWCTLCINILPSLCSLQVTTTDEHKTVAASIRSRFEEKRSDNLRRKADN